MAIMCDMFLSVLLYSNSSSIGEEIFVGAISALIFSVILWLFNSMKNKKGIEKEMKQVQQDIVDESLLSTDASSPIELDFDYSYLYDELKCKCNPSNYMTPYDPRKVEISNSIYMQLEESKENVLNLIKLRNRAIKELGIEFSAKELYERLSQIFNPSNYMDENYDAAKLHVANLAYAQVQENKDDIIELERIAVKNRIRLFPRVAKVEEDNVTERGALIGWVSICAAILIVLLLSIVQLWS